MATDAQPEIDSPRDVESEQWVLGSCMTVPDLIDECSVLLRPSDFFVEAHGIVFRVLQELHAANKTIDAVILAKRLKKETHLMSLLDGNVGALLIDLAEAAPVPAHARVHAQRVREESVKRGIISACMTSAVDARNSDGNSGEILARTESRIMAIEDSRLTESICHASEAVKGFMSQFQARMSGDKGLPGVETGFTDLDRLLGSLRPGELIILAARPSMGKSALAVNIASYAAIDRALPTLLISLEMSNTELCDRIVSSRTNVPLNDIKRGTVNREDQRLIVAEIGELSQSELWMDETPIRTISEVCSTARRMKRKNKIGLIIIDYLQLIEPENPRDVREQQVAKMSKRLKALARQLNIPVVVLAQLNRLVEGRPNKTPRLSDLRESGSIEQDADVVMFVHREEYYLSPKEVDDKNASGKADIIVAKQRNGETGTVSMKWVKECTRFETLPKGEEWNPACNTYDAFQ
jgi:replicative DNA helicase